MSVILILGCWGREVKDLILCRAIFNQVLDLSKPSERNNEIMDFLDDRYKLFDRPLYSNVHTALWNLQDHFSQVGNPLFAKDYFKCLEEFCVNHSKCGLYLRLELKE